MKAKFTRFLIGSAIVFSICGTLMLGCHLVRQYHSPQIIPVLNQPIAMMAKVKHLPAEGIIGTDLVQVPRSQMNKLLWLIRPTQSMEKAIDRRFEYYVADVYLIDADGAMLHVRVRWTGDNCAAVSLDDKHYYYGGESQMPYGAINIVRLIKSWEYDAKQENK